MKISIWKKTVLSVLLGVGALTFPNTAQTAEQKEECSKEILLAYFPQVFVNETLARFNVPKDQWDAINKELSAKDKEIIKLVEAKAEKMTPNPLKDPQQRQVAVKIFRETLLENFSNVMKAHGVTDDKQIQAMLDDIQKQKAERFARCMGQKKESGKSDDDEDEDDED